MGNYPNLKTNNTSFHKIKLEKPLKNLRRKLLRNLDPDLDLVRKLSARRKPLASPRGVPRRNANLLRPVRKFARRNAQRRRPPREEDQRERLRQRRSERNDLIFMIESYFISPGNRILCNRFIDTLYT